MKNIKFPPEPDSFLKDLKQEIDNYFHTNSLSKLANNKMYFKIAFLLGVYLLTYSSIFIVGNKNPYILFVLYPILGALGVFLGLNIGHDAAHNTLFKSKKH